MQLFHFDLTVNASGAATVTSSQIASGCVHQIRYVPDGTNPLDTGAHLTITESASGLPILTKEDIGTAAVVWAPRQPTHGVADGAALLYAAGGSAVNDRIAVNGKIKVVVANGGASKTGKLHIWVG